MLLTSLGHETRGAQSGSEALTQAKAFEPELVLLDLVLPDISGYTVAMQLRDEARHGFYLAALTGLGDARARARARDAGCDRHLVKPITLAGLRDVVACALSPWVSRRRRVAHQAG